MRFFMAMKTPRLIALALLIAASPCLIADTPGFLKPGQMYILTFVGVPDFRIRVVELLPDGWVRVRHLAATTDASDFWINAAQIQMVKELPQKEGGPN